MIRLITLLLLALCTFLSAQPRVLIVNAHPDDESGCAATVYKITHDLKGTVDLCCITNGEGGYKYSTLAEDWYGVELTEESIGRAHLPRIRKQEMLNAAKVIGLRNVFFLEHLDHRYTTDMGEVFTKAWNAEDVSKQIAGILQRGQYDYVFCLLPTPETHGAHKAATLLALQQVGALSGKKPIVLGVGFARADSIQQLPKTLDSIALTKLRVSTAPFVFDRSMKFGFNDRLNYKIIAAWLVAEHKSQGTVQLGIQDQDLEVFYYFDCNPAEGLEPTRKLFDDLKVIRYKKKTY